MRAVVVHTFGGPEALELVDVAVPTPGPGQVRIRVSAAAVNPVDAVTRAGALVEAGLMAPRAVTGIGWDVAGEIDELGAGVDRFTLGQRVIGLRDLLDRSLGSYADYLVLDASAVAPAPAGRSAVEAATLPLNGLTALQALDQLALTEGDTLLVTGAAGAVGGFAVEIAARWRGLRVIAQAGDADAELVRRLGAEWVVPREAVDLADAVRALVPGGVDAVLDTAGLGAGALAAVRNRGSFVTVVGGADPIPLRGIRVHHTWISADGAALATLAGYDLTLRVADTLPIEQAVRAHTRLAEGGLRGRIVLTTAPGGGS
ncbi:NADPH:quinone reductase [Nocardia neocaledoniensis NBRC 108232]|uniref:NADPH:quinone reductase-like Zn-dependent oxidoreductase n=1 Tax=Nocardia neocaledoniensis TaxID=236511 RepID=A0A317NE10_9NOCA|nr:NADP-dependent oxidoreductase [Nocardia neocaledoniensis]PWV73541.1 NADPH:quinone reductase-like Zn-dependent oxidoreductase [Nocardia neocaledoniensis]GEM29938.1 NADPH:quinone reductase [Nocardia neocaledoniensis NBRC 108232]